MPEDSTTIPQKTGTGDDAKIMEPVKEDITEKPTTSEPEAEQDTVTETVDPKVDNDEEELPPALPQRKAKSASSETHDGSADRNPIFEQLKEAFPNMESKFIKAVIIASQGALDPAFNALLYLSDPESGKDIELPKEPIAVGTPQLPARRQQSQLEQDEILARQLDEQYNRTQQRTHRSRGSDAERQAHRQRLRDRQRRKNHPLSPEEQRELEAADEDSWTQFMEKDLPVLRERANRSIQDTATKLNGWISGIRRNLVGEGSQEAQNPHQAGDYYDDPYSQQRDEEFFDEKTPKKPERRRFNSFGAQIQDDSLESHGITLQSDDLNDDADEEDDIPPQLGSPKIQKDSAGHKTGAEEKVVAQTTYIDTPDNATRKKWQPVPPEPLNETPTKTAPERDQPKKATKNADEDEFLINSEDEM
ncbi:hypothetical protein HG536_0H02870 [Torulaspora globosa]|uniref:CUE domain-containing protein n=1 Tax=Torulaspora globosa TaxID=48254 RepID=A0A7G3ZN26_9SACH|nr:uncharacterized protein HG536_0H02870 [Torulaspora globosa]QLL34912.1 hypothetical protein HG536_0H02870 [Torulaspora globosa]